MLKARPPSDRPVIVLTPLEFELYLPVLQRRADGYWYGQARVIVSPRTRPAPR